MTSLSPATLVLAALACLFLALALGLLLRAQHRQQQQSTRQHLQRRLDLQLDQLHKAEAGASPSMGRTQASALSTWIEQHLSLGAWGITPQALLLLLGCGLLLLLLASVKGGLVLGLMALALYALLCSFAIWRRLSKRREKLLHQLPGFLDNMVRLISIGNSPHAAFQLAAGNVPAPLGQALEQAVAALSASPDLGQAMGQLERSWRLAEFGLLAAVFRMSVRYGGRADLVLERVSTYIRDRQSAERELHAMSAEIRLSAWVLALLPIVVGALIMVLNQGYFMRMWNDASGQRMILIAAGLEAFGSLLLYRLARLK
ncbi:type II secretion system F family protein [Comamonas composti]|uniref:type II secretion system F family protein n=1 Tax=Comamonas composti TaxID=408558 RepID=UPI00041FB627|nr:type II secretion system F family protein [Comamonas composti]